MKKRNPTCLEGAILLALGAWFLMASCVTATVSGPPSIAKAETAVAVPLLVIDAKPNSFTGSFGYKINLENVATGDAATFSVYAAFSEGYTLMKGIPEGEYLIKDYEGFSLSDTKHYKFNIQKYLTVKKGEVTIFPLKLVFIIVESKQEASQSSIYFDYWEFNEKTEIQIRKMINGEGPKLTSNVIINPEIDLK